MSQVDLGYAEKCEPWQVESYLFPCKVGGKPAWLDLEDLPKPEQLQCDICHNPLTFFCQIYAPFEEDSLNFHRTIFVFLCRNADCCVRNANGNLKVFRSSLTRRNKFYSFEPPADEEDVNFSLNKWVKLCALCGCFGEKQCSKCKATNYCSREHQVLDWKETHKQECQNAAPQNRALSSHLFPEFEIVIEAEETKQTQVDESEELEKFHQMETDGKTGTMRDLSPTEVEKYAASDNDKAFTRFKEIISVNLDQILRYERGGKPLWIASEPTPETIPNCEYCGTARQYEFQIMPQILSILHENELDIGVIAVYTCGKSCVGGAHYKSEFVFKQDVAINN